MSNDRELLLDLLDRVEILEQKVEELEEAVEDIKKLLEEAR